MAEHELTDEVLEGMTAALQQYADLLDESAAYAAQKQASTAHPGQELYWGGFVEGIRMASEMAREMRPLRGIK